MYNSKITKSQELELIDLYKKGVKTSELCKKYGWSLNNRHGPLNILKKYKIDIREDNKTHSKKYKLNENYFKIIDTKDKAYFLGLLYADGSMNKKYNELRLALQKKDVEILEVFNNYLETNKPLRLIKKRNLKHSDMYSINIENKILCEDAKKLGLVNNKTNLLEFPDKTILPEKLISHFVRGFFDGDGCVTVKKRILKNNNSYSETLFFSFTATYQMCESLQKIFNKNINLNINKIHKRHKNRKANTYHIVYGGNKQALKFYNWLYKDCENLKITRKKLKFENINSPIQK